MTRLQAVIAGVLLFAWPVRADELADVLGVAHSHGRYYFTAGDYLNEGADAILGTGSRVIKLYLMSRVADKYEWNTTWPDKFASLEDLAKQPQFRAVFAKPFKTYILTTYAIGRRDHYWTTGVTPEQLADETKQFHDLAKHFLTTYRGTGKTFVLCNWEGDWALRDVDGHTFDKSYTPTRTAIEGMIAWLNARQAGIVGAREEVRDTDVRVFGAVEANRVLEAIDGQPRVANEVLPHANVDFVSYSAWDSQADHAKLAQAVDYLASKLPPTAAFGRDPRSVYVGEFGAPENGAEGVERVTKNLDNVLSVTREKHLPWAVYWQIYCNELIDKATTRPVNNENGAVKGFWMIKPDGTRSVAWHRYHELLNP